MSRVTVLTPSFPRYRGDYHGVFIKNLCDQLAQHVSLDVIAPRTRTMKPTRFDYPVKRFPYMPNRRMEYIAEETMKNAPMNILAALPVYLISAYIHMIAEKSDLIHTHLAIPFGFLAAHNPSKTPQIITCHGSDITYPIEKPKLRCFVRNALRKADRVVAVSDYIRKLAIKVGSDPAKTETIYLGVDTEKFHPSGRKRQNTLGTLGRLVPEKKIDEILYSAEELKRKIDLKIRIGGDGPDQERLMKLAEKLNLDIEFTGRVLDPVSFHQSLDVFILASTREGLSTSLQEAMACGAVPVAVNLHGCREIIKDQINGYLYTSGNKRMLNDKILEALNSKVVAQRARETIERSFNSESATREYLRLYEELGIFLR